jgi:hypothetical protein
MKRIHWLASYPKSGNTWMRVFFTNLRWEGSQPAHINHLLVNFMAADRQTFDDAVGYDSADLSHDEVDRIRPEVYSYYARRAKNPFFCKVHDAYTLLPDGRPMFPPEATAGAIYLVRNPLDVCVSYAHHSGEQDFDVIIDWMEDTGMALLAENDRREPGQLRQRLSTWSDHVLSWADAPNLSVLVIRYEDMKKRPVETFGEAAGFVGMTTDRARIERALEFSALEVLQSQEQESGFRGALAPDRPFFRKGKVGSWREVLTTGQVARIIDAHHEVMLRFGYLTEAGEPVG